jgi:hypothetical protein
MDLHAWEPFEGGGRDVVIAFDSADRWIQIETGQNRISDRRHAAVREVLWG